MGHSFPPMTLGQTIPILEATVPEQLKEAVKNGLVGSTFLEALRVLRVKLGVAE